MFFTLEDYKNIEEYLRQNSKKDTDFPTTLLIKEDDYIPIIQDAVNKKMTVEDLRVNLSKGPRGESAYEVAVRHGYVGTEEQWLASLEGKSAYQIAVELGYVGTEAEWIASLKGAKGDDGRDADIWTIGEDDFWYVNGRKTIFKSRGEDGKSPLLRISTDGQSLEISSDGGQTWLPFEKNFNKLRVLGYVNSTQLLPRNANIGDIYGVWNPDVYSGRVDEEGHLIKGAYDLYVNTVRDWVDDYHITKVYDYDTELPSSAANGTTVLVPVDYLTLDKTKIDGYKVYRFSLDRNGWVLILDTAEIYVSKDDIINYGDNVFALVQSEEEHTYELYRRDVGWVYFGTNASITYVLVQDIDEGTETNILSGKAVTDAYGHYIESPEFVRAYLDSEDKILWGIKADGTIYYGAGVPPQVKNYIEEKIADLSLDEYEDIVAFLDDLEKGDKTIQDLLDEKVDKEEGKSLIDEEYAEGVHYIENPEFLEVKLDQDDRILEAIMLDGTKLLSAGYEIGGNVVKTISSPEYLAAWLDSYDHILFALKADGDVIFGCGIPSQIKGLVSELIETFHYENSPEFIDVKLDSKGKVLEGIRNDGTKVIGGNLDILGSLDINGITYSVVSNPEWLKAVVDSDNKIICGIKTDGTFCVVDIDFLDSSNKTKEIINHFDTINNSEFLSVELDENEKVLGGRKTDGTKFENVGLDLGGALLKCANDYEGRSEITTDAEGKILSYRDSDGVKHEEVGIKTNRLEFTKQGMTEFQQALKDAGFNPGGAGDWSDYISFDGEKPLKLPEPILAHINITNDTNTASWPTSKTNNFEYYIEFFDGNGNYFKKKIICNAQGNSSMGYIKKNMAIDLFDSEWDEDALKIAFGGWVPQDSFHLKAYYTDFFRCTGVIAYKLAQQVYKTRGFLKDVPWKYELLKGYDFSTTKFSPEQPSDISIQMDNGAMCMPDGFPCIMYLNGDFYGIYNVTLKKNRDNYHMNKKKPKQIHLDPEITMNDSDFFVENIDRVDWSHFEIRNPKDIVYAQPHNGSYKYDADVALAEIAGNHDGSTSYPNWVAGSYSINTIVKKDGHLFINTLEGNSAEPIYDKKNNGDDAPDFKNKTGCNWINCTNTVKVKEYILNLTQRCSQIKNVATVSTENGDIQISSYGGVYNPTENFGKGIWVSEEGTDSLYMSIHSTNIGNSLQNTQYWADVTSIVPLVRQEIEKYFDINNIIDYLMMSLITRDQDGTYGPNWQWITYDGKKWYVQCYDKDRSWGLFWPWAYGLPTEEGLNVFNGPFKFVNQMYSSDIKNRWNELVQKNIFSVENIIGLYKNYMSRFGECNYEKEYIKWNDTPVNRDSGIDTEHWEFVDSNNYIHISQVWNPTTIYYIGAKIMLEGICYESLTNSNQGNDPRNDRDNWEIISYQEEKVYQPGDICYCGTNIAQLAYRALVETQGNIPLTNLSHSDSEPMGYHDSIWRIYSYIDENIKKTDNFINNKFKTY